eukprot:NODE_3431_length_2037_cov_3.835602.p1 GENE.NODE_3431_length_2037_cov_3.835602~~NODE_3431_length_2037_cov_3.835602.p1  ORF type:complete len:540 (+),score=160.99 NODE_3431_length_2037_cov_3.835602:196-1620(+)
MTPAHIFPQVEETAAWPAAAHNDGDYHDSQLGGCVATELTASSPRKPREQRAGGDGDGNSATIDGWADLQAGSAAPTPSRGSSSQSRRELKQEPGAGGAAAAPADGGDAEDTAGKGGGSAEELTFVPLPPGMGVDADASDEESFASEPPLPPGVSPAGVVAGAVSREGVAEGRTPLLQSHCRGQIAGHFRRNQEVARQAKTQASSCAEPAKPRPYSDGGANGFSGIAECQLTAPGPLQQQQQQQHQHHHHQQGSAASSSEVLDQGWLEPMRQQNNESVRQRVQREKREAREAQEAEHLFALQQVRLETAVEARQVKQRMQQLDQRAGPGLGAFASGGSGLSAFAGFGGCSRGGGGGAGVDPFHEMGGSRMQAGDDARGGRKQAVPVSAATQPWSGGSGNSEVGGVRASPLAHAGNALLALPAALGSSASRPLTPAEAAAARQAAAVAATATGRHGLSSRGCAPESHQPVRRQPR